MDMNKVNGHFYKKLKFADPELAKHALGLAKVILTEEEYKRVDDVTIWLVSVEAKNSLERALTRY